MSVTREHGTPIPNRKIERMGPVNSKVIAYFLTPEELEEIRRKYPQRYKGRKPNKGTFSMKQYWSPGW